MSTYIVEKPAVNYPEAVERFDLTDMFPYEEPADGKEHKAHIVNVLANEHIGMEGMDAQEIVDIARLTGAELEALCGYKWVPKLNPDKLDVCEACMKRAQEIMSEQGE